METRPKTSLAELVRRGQDALEREDYAEAEVLSRRALMKDPDAWEAKQVLASALIEQARYEEAVPWLQEILEQEPDDVVSLADLGLCLFEMCLFEEAEAVLARALEVDGSDPHACYWMALCVERRGYYDLAEEYFRQAHEVDPETCPLPHRVPREEFEEVVEEALAELPEEIRGHLANLSIVIDDLPRREDLVEGDLPLDPCLYGLYVGVPLPERGHADLPQLPDRIYVYRRNLERFCEDRDVLVEQIRITVLHEVGHYLGYDEDDLAERGLA
jgi:predicted Zn-dependent protease with MMP-like domain